MDENLPSDVKTENKVRRSRDKKSLNRLKTEEDSL